MDDHEESPSQTAGPYVHIGCMPSTAGLEGMYGGKDPGAQMITGDPAGERMTLTLHLTDGAGDPVTDAMIEIWQPGPDGSFGPTDGFSHWGRQPTGSASGGAVFETLKPGGGNGQAPHVFVWIAARGINIALMTRVYFPDAENGDDPVFLLAGERSSTLVAEKTDDGYQHVIRLQGDAETVFFDA